MREREKGGRERRREEREGGRRYEAGINERQGRQTDTHKGRMREEAKEGRGKGKRI